MLVQRHLKAVNRPKERGQFGIPIVPAIEVRSILAHEAAKRCQTTETILVRRLGNALGNEGNRLG